MMLSRFFFILSLCIGVNANSNPIEINDKIKFNVYRNESKIGFHNVELNAKDSSITAIIKIKFQVTFLGFVVYDYVHNNQEEWINGKLVSLKTTTNKNGDNLFCSLEKKSGLISIIGTNGKYKITEELMPTSYWDFRLVNNVTTRKVINTQDCSYIDFNITNLGKESIYNNKIDSYHYKLVGFESTGEKIDIDIWYDDKKNWVKMIFLKDGSKIEYFLDEYDTN